MCCVPSQPAISIYALHASQEVFLLPPITFTSRSWYLYMAENKNRNFMGWACFHAFEQCIKRQGFFFFHWKLKLATDKWGYWISFGFISSSASSQCQKEVLSPFQFVNDEDNSARLCITKVGKTVFNEHVRKSLFISRRNEAIMEQERKTNGSLPWCN